MHGEGIFYFSLGGLIYGNFAHNKAEGLCRLVFPNGDSIVGKWNEGKLHGYCIKYFEAQKAWILCDYCKGELIKVFRRGNQQPPYGIVYCYSGL